MRDARWHLLSRKRATTRAIAPRYSGAGVFAPRRLWFLAERVKVCGKNRGWSDFLSRKGSSAAACCRKWVVSKKYRKKSCKSSRRNGDARLHPGVLSRSHVLVGGDQTSGFLRGGVVVFLCQAEEVSRYWEKTAFFSQVFRGRLGSLLRNRRSRFSSTLLSPKKGFCW
ncbi:hypothetical protein TGPRC2_305990 [Toxoplasma gondii TgCatPRC2]|uniref:Uncharacterized protein n=2 Tax=Toxoplasma gondii TaxID=5811 RepID=A0A151H5L8_TOXGO|nr:hypothetical protein TGARI_305990 [Toxoplasma gondii ARI]KYK64624.1 hypothetical protein TGPRC2_305990 [Toxoplasma gondii TgCatPRC2]